MSSRKKVLVEGEEVKSEPEEIEETVTEQNSDKRTLLCKADGKDFQVTIPAKAKVTFAPWAPSGERRDYGPGASRGTLRIYTNSAPNASIIFVKSGVTEFRDLAGVDYEEATEEIIGQRVWRSDKFGHTVHEEVKRTPNTWETPPERQLPKVDDKDAF